MLSTQDQRDNEDQVMHYIAGVDNSRSDGLSNREPRRAIDGMMKYDLRMQEGCDSRSRLASLLQGYSLRIIFVTVLIDRVLIARVCFEGV